MNELSGVGFIFGDDQEYCVSLGAAGTKARK